LQNVFCSVFELPSLRNTRKRDKTKKVEEKLPSIFLSKFWEKFSTWTFCKNILMVFMNSPCRETPKNVLIKKIKEKKVGWWVTVGTNARLTETCTTGAFGGKTALGMKRRPFQC
jgi:hypothetical protein